MSNKIPIYFARFLDEDLNLMGTEGLILTGVAHLICEKALVNSMAKDVEDFHVKYGIQYEGHPRMLDKELSKFRIARAKEEIKEYAAASVLHEKLDALIDEIYIALGTLHLHGFSPLVIQEAWDRVHKANMAKELASEANPGKHGSPIDIVKPAGWVAPDHRDLCGYDI